MTSQSYAVSISIPVGWQPTPYLGNFGYDGTSGWVQFNAMVEPFGLYAKLLARAGSRPGRRSN